MRTSLVSVLAALVSIASTFPTGYSAHQGRVAARDPTKARSPPLTPVNVLRNVPRAAEVKPSNKPDRRRGEPAYVPRAAEVKPSNKPDRRRGEPAYVRRAAETKPSNKPDRRRDEPAYIPRAVQNAFGGNWFGGGLLGWLDEDQCPEPLFACPVRGARDPDAFECVDLESDLYSCGGCAADDIAYDCNAISHARSVECVSGFCEVRTCAEGYVVAPMRDVCVRVGPR